MKTIFLTGTDTGVGKTHIGRIIVEDLIKSGYRCEPRKPVETGCKLSSNGELIPEDATLYEQATQGNSTLSDICPYRYEPPISPERAIRLANSTVLINDLARACKPRRTPDFLLVEGAGGFYSPLCSDGLNADLAQNLQASVILVVNDQLGCINQTLLSIQAITSRKLSICAIVLNQTREHEQSAMDNYDDLKTRLSLPIIAMPNMADSHHNLHDNYNKVINQLLNIIKE